MSDIKLVEGKILDLPLPVVDALIDHLSNALELEPVEAELLEALQLIHPLLVEIQTAKLN